MFPTITSIEEFRSHTSHKEEIREADIGHGAKSFCYMISAEGTFDTDWLRECRGIVFNEAGQVSGRPLHKFFNVGERPSTRAENIDWSKVVRVMLKADGSMIHTVKTADGFKLKSKKAFSSSVAIDATKWVSERKNYQDFCEYCVSHNITAIFEWMAPDSRIVIFYSTPQLGLLHIRCNVTGRYFTVEEIEKLSSVFHLHKVEEVDEFFDMQIGNGYKITFNYQRMLDAAKTREGIEGWVIQFENGDMVKVKTEQYLKLHRAMTFLRERDVAQLVIDETIDDLKSQLVAEGVNIDEILAIEKRVVERMIDITNSIYSVYEADKTLLKKDFAIKHKEHKYFGLLMSLMSGKELSIKDYFEKNILKQEFSLRQLSMVPKDPV
jgi:RNA ligase